MERKERFPQLLVRVDRFRENVDKMTELCADQGIEVAGVIKGFHAIDEMVQAFDQSQCKYIASSRIEQLEKAKKLGCHKPLFLIRVPMLSEVAELVRVADYSLVSELEVIEKINQECKVQSKRHGVVIMVDLGDLREGFWDEKELIEAAAYVENQLEYVDLMGIGTNLGCYGSIQATPEKMNDLIRLAEKIENVIGRKLDIISGGGTTSTMMVFNKTMPERINHLRIGEGIILAHDYEALFNTKADFLNKDVFTLRGEIIELKDKPSYPVGELSFDAFGQVQEYEDRGIRRRALVGLGRVDVGDPDMLKPCDDRIEILGASSDHLILDVENCKDELSVGAVVDFEICYANMVYVTSSENVNIVAV